MYRDELNQLPSWTIAVVILLAIWSLYWKAAALWHAARSKQLNWFILFTLINTCGIVELIYLFGVEKISSDKLFKK